MSEENVKPSKFRKYGPYVAVPAAIFAVIATDLINNVNHREAVEKVFPSLVNFIRKYYGFDDENPEEIRRIARINHLQQSKIRVEVSVDSGYQRAIQIVDGNTRCTDISGTASIFQTYGTNLLSFPDQTEAEAEIPIRRLRDASLDVHLGRDILKDSEWAPAAVQETPSRYATIASLTIEPYNNVLKNLFKGFNSFYSLGPPSLAMLTVLPSHQNAVVVKKTPKELALERIEMLQRQLEQLQQDRIIGFRDIDSVEEDIRRTKSEISSLQRKHVNTFSFW